MTEEDIINLWKKVGWTSSKEYHDYLMSGKDAPDDTIGSLLNPDKINVKTFWKATDTWFCSNNKSHHLIYDYTHTSFDI